MAQHRQNRSPKRSTQACTKRRVREADYREDQWPHGLAVVTTTVRGGTHGRAPSHARPCVPWPLRVSSVFARLFVFWRFLLCFCLIIPMYQDILAHTIHSIEFSNFQSQIRVVFRERKRERRRTARILERVLRSKDDSTVLDEQILSLLLSFLISSLCVVILL